MYKILLADDEGIVLDSLKFIISKNFGQSCEVQTAKTGRQGIEIAQSFVPDIIMMDIQMPGIKGIDALREIRTFNKNAQFIIMSAYDKFTFAQEAINLGVIEYLTKPADKTKIVAALEKAMAAIDKDRSSRSQNLMIREKLEAVIPVIENGFINVILFQDDPAPSLSRYQELLSQTCSYGYILVIDYREDASQGIGENPVGSTVVMQKHLLAFREIIHDFFPECCIGPIMAGNVAVFVPHDTDDMPYAERIAIIETSRNMVRKLKKQIGLQFRAGLGNIWPLTEQKASYEEAKKSLRMDKSSVVHLRDIKMELEYEADYPSDLENQMFSYVTKGDLDNAVRYANLFFDWMVDAYPDYPDSIRLKSLEFVMWAEKEVFLKGGIPYGFLYRKDYLETVLSFHSFDELRHWFTDKIMAAARNINDSKNEKESSTVGKAKSYILQNFDKELSLEDVSKYVDISPYYFSKLFKEETEQTFIEYLTSLRIEKAKQMLNNPNVTIKEICVAVGYSDPNYFSRIFKKVTGQTPTEYRDTM